VGRVTIAPTTRPTPSELLISDGKPVPGTGCKPGSPSSKKVEGTVSAPQPHHPPRPRSPTRNTRQHRQHRQDPPDPPTAAGHLATSTTPRPPTGSPRPRPPWSPAARPARQQPRSPHPATSTATHGHPQRLAASRGHLAGARRFRGALLALSPCSLDRPPHRVGSAAPRSRDTPMITNAHTHQQPPPRGRARRHVTTASPSPPARSTARPVGARRASQSANGTG